MGLTLRVWVRQQLDGETSVTKKDDWQSSPLSESQPTCSVSAPGGALEPEIGNSTSTLPHTEDKRGDLASLWTTRPPDQGILTPEVQGRKVMCPGPPFPKRKARGGFLIDKPIAAASK